MKTIKSWVGVLGVFFVAALSLGDARVFAGEGAPHGIPSAAPLAVGHSEFLLRYQGTNKELPFTRVVEFKKASTPGSSSSTGSATGSTPSLAGELTFQYETPEGKVSEYFQLNDKGHTVSWKYKVVSPNETLKGTEIVAKREGNVVKLSGSHLGEKIEREFEIDEKPWLQPYTWGLKAFLDSKEEDFEFWSIATRGGAQFKIGTLDATKKDTEKKDQDTGLQRVRIGLTGLKSIFWHADLFLRKTDGVMVRYEGSEKIAQSLVSQN